MPTYLTTNWRACVAALFLLIAGISCQGDSAYQTSFDDAENWGVGDNPDVEGKIANGVYDLYVKADTGIYWVTAGKTNLGDGVYEVEATQTSGPLDNGYGIIVKADSENDNFYLFEISGDGYYWIGYCQNGCETHDILVSDGWVESSIINAGINNPNTLRVELQENELIFAVNGQEVGRGVDNRAIPRGDVGLLVETLGNGGVRVAFDNLRYTPSQE